MNEKLRFALAYIIKLTKNLSKGEEAFITFITTVFDLSGKLTVYTYCRKLPPTLTVCLSRLTTRNCISSSVMFRLTNLIQLVNSRCEKSHNIHVHVRAFILEMEDNITSFFAFPTVARYSKNCRELGLIVVQSSV